MPKEIERKFLTKNDTWRKVAEEQKSETIIIRQTYISDSDWGIVRLRQAGNKAFLAIKTRSKTISRDEYEYEIPLEHAHELFATLNSNNFIEKTRYKIEHCGHIWEVDEFSGLNEGLIIAEIELQSEDEEFERPDWAGEEVSKVGRFFNSALSKNPIKENPIKEV